MQRRSRDEGVENGRVDPVGEGERGMSREYSTDIYSPPGVKCGFERLFPSAAGRSSCDRDAAPLSALAVKTLSKEEANLL